jgi:acetoin utilization deacetylase AcuC-like enzyme
MISEEGNTGLKLFYTDHFVIPLAENHSFPIEKYSQLRERVTETNIVDPKDMCIPHAATLEEILRVHDPDYVRRVINGELTSKEIKRIGFPWSDSLVERARRSCGATIEASRAAVQDGIAVNLAGGTHHAFADRGEGYCLFNDSAIASRAMQEEGLVQRILIIDCDVHQGNGTASIFAGDPTVFTFSIHNGKNFPFQKEKSDLDISLDDGVDDLGYLEVLEKGVIRALELSRAELAIYLAGADPYADDRFGRLSLSKKGLAQRDRMVLGYCRQSDLPVAITMAGGYARRVEDTVDIHFQTVKTAAGVLGSRKVS